MARDVVKAITLQSFDTASADATFQPLDANGLTESCVWVQLFNNSDIDLLISLDGINYNFFLAIDSYITLPAQNNSQPNNQRLMFKKGQIFYVTSFTGAAGMGRVFLSGLYSDPS